MTIGEFGGFTRLMFSTMSEDRLIASSTMGDISVIDPRNGEIVKTIKGHTEPVNDIKEIQLFGE